MAFIRTRRDGLSGDGLSGDGLSGDGLSGDGPARAGPLDLDTASRQELYEEAQRQEIAGRSKMNKAQLQAALAKRGKR